ncbi:MAG: hypothetical protein LBG52_04655 [Candidatus Peribacteria bacterium]|jgi:hypothetical protein|nr:hypothetical protein [Candidatus Peribacteria bacterium]
MAQLGWRGCPKTFLNETKEILHIDAYLTKIKQQIFAKGRRFGEDGALYSFTTENITGYYQHFNFQEKNCLTIGGSGDHMINAFLL